MSESFKEVLKKDKFIITAEIGPVKGTDTQNMVGNIKLLKDKVDALNVTDNQGAVMRYPSIGGCLLVKEQGGEPIFQMTCRDRNRVAIQGDLLFAFSRGIENVLCLTGDSLQMGDHPEARPVYDIDSVQLIQLVHILNSGKDLSGNELNGGVNFCIGASATPSSDPIEPQLIKFEKKLKAGIDFVQTQAIYDLEELDRFVDYSKKIDNRVKILAGIVLLSSSRMAKWMNDNIPGIFVPGDLIDEMEKVTGDRSLAKGIEIVGNLVRRIKEKKICDGVHIMAIDREKNALDIIEAAGI